MSLYLAVFGKPRYLGLIDSGDLELSTGCWVVIETLRGLEMGLLGGSLSREQEGKYRSTCLNEASDEHTKGPEPMLQEVGLIGVASAAQIEEHNARRVNEETILLRARQLLRAHQFQMKLVDVEYTMDHKKLFFYFTSEQRVDFRAYVRDLAKEFRIRIEMRQIGVRDEAKTVRGVAPCGRPCCCSYWLHRFTPINIRMVKEQNLALNPTKISGICGRLMCCMYYEHSTYSELWKTLPSPGSKIKTPQGNYVLDGVDLHKEVVRVRFPEGGEVPIPAADFARFKEAILNGETWQREEGKNTESDRKPTFLRGRIPRVTLKPEKTSTEEHAPEKARANLQPVQSQTSQDPQKAEGSTAAKKRQRKRRDMPADSRKQEEHVRAQEIKERRRPLEQRPNNEPTEDARKGTQSEVKAHGAHARNSHSRPRHKGGNRGRERPGTGSADAVEKGDS